MTRTLVLSLMAAAAAAAVTPSQDGSLGDAAVRDAIAAGLAGRTQEASCTSKVDPRGHYVRVTAVGPVGRIMRAARSATSEGRPFTIADVTAELRAPLLVVSASAHLTEPTDPGPSRAFPGDLAPTAPTRDRMPARIGGIRLAAGGPHPATLEPTLTTDVWRRDEGAFPLSAVATLGTPVEVRFLTTTGHQTTTGTLTPGYTSCWLGAGELAKAR